MKTLLQRAGSQLPALFSGLCVALAASAAPGDIDPSFGNNGKVDITLGQSVENVDRVLVQPDGKIIAVGTSNSRLALARYDAAGALDPGFGSGGMLTVSDGTSAYTTGALLQPSGKIVVMAFCVPEFWRCLLRFNADGTPDTGFGSGGRMFVAGGGAATLALAQGPDGKIVGSLANGPFGAFRASADGVLDSSLGSGGYATVAVNNAHASGVAVQGDGKVVVTGHRFDAPSGFIARRFGVDGSEDTAFSAAFDANVLPVSSEAFAGAVQPDGKILIAGCTPLSPTSDSFLTMVRVLPTGVLDPGFGSGTGIVHLPTPDRCARSISVRSDGRIVMASSSRSSFSSQLEAVQLLPDGSPDPAFGSAGLATLVGDGAAQPARDAALQSDGKLVIGGAKFSRDFAVGRLMPDGSPDATFGNGGVATTEFWGGRRTTFREFARAPQGKAVALVQLEDKSSYTAPIEGEVSLVRLLADGSLDSTFGVGGKAYGSLHSDPAATIGSASEWLRAHALTVRSDQKIVVAGLGFAQGERGATVMRFNADGTVDTAFGISGRRLIGASDDGESTGVHKLLLQNDGSIIAVGKLRTTAPAAVRSFVARLTPDGSLDPTFAQGGVAFFTASDPDVEPRLRMGVVLQPDGRIVVSGLENNRFSAFRLLADGSLDPEFLGNGMVVLPPPVAPGGQPYRLIPRGVALHLGSVVMFATAVHPTATYGNSPAVARVGPNGMIFPTLAGGGPIVFKDLAGEVLSGAIDSAGRLVLAGSTARTTMNLDALWRFNEAGAPDTLFGPGGMVDTALGDCALGGLAIEPDDDMLVGCAGSNYLSFVAMRVKGGGPSSFSRPADIDNDGIPDGIEWVEGRDAATRDNDVFGSAHLFVMQQYRDFLAREGDPGGVGFWEGEVSSGRSSRGQAIESFFSSPEFQGAMAPVARMYFAYFLRIPDYSGLNFWIQYFRDGHSLDEISNFFAGSAEFQSMYGSLDNAAFVTLVYQNVLGRAPDPGGFAFWKGQLDNGIRTRGQVMLGFSESDEYRGSSDSMVYVTMMYFGMLRRAPEQGGFDFWVGYRNAGNSGLALIDAFLGSPEYRSRFLP